MGTRAHGQPAVPPQYGSREVDSFGVTSQILDRWGLPAETDQTVTDREALFAELEVVREQGYAVNHEENIDDLHAVGVAATEQNGNIIGGFSITGPKHSFTGPKREKQLAETLIELVNEYELELSLSR